jgi:hypothetical protein
MQSSANVSVIVDEDDMGPFNRIHGDSMKALKKETQMKNMN